MAAEFEDALENHGLDENEMANEVGSNLLMTTPSSGSNRGVSIQVDETQPLVSNVEQTQIVNKQKLNSSVRAMGTRKMGFQAIAHVKRLEKKERSTKRLMDGTGSNRSRSFGTSIRNLIGSTRSGDGSDRNTPKKYGSMDRDEASVDEEEEEEKETVFEVLTDIIFGKFVSIFLICIPFAWMSHHFEWGSQWVFWLNFLVMIPLAAILGDFTEEVAAHTNQVIGGLINATFGNAVEVVVAIQALYANEIRVVQASMIGSIFSNLLLVLGCCFFFGGLKYKEQSFNSTAATANMSLLALSSIALVLPTPFAEYYDIQDENVLQVSRIAAIFLIFMYVQLLVFQLKTHVHLFEDEDEDEPEISMTVSLTGLLCTTVAITFFSEMLVDSIDGFCATSGVSRTFVGIIILPIVGNAVEHVTAVTVAMKDKMDLAMGIAVGSCTQISLFVVPLTVLIGWGIDKNMTLNFPHFEIVLYVLSVFTVSVCVSNPKGNWLEGSLLITTYFMLALGFWYEKVQEDF